MSTSRITRPFLLLAALLPLATVLAQAPVAKVEPVTDDYYGTKVVDPYRWMESGKDPDWMPWLQTQAKHTQGVFAGMPGRAKLLADVAARSGELNGLGRAEQAGGRIFYDIRAAGEQDVKLMVREADGAARVLLDPTTLKGADGDQVIDSWDAAPDGRHVVVALSKRGTELSTLRVLETDAAKFQPVTIPHAASLSWTGDSNAFSYLKFVGEPGQPSYFVNNETRLHRLGGSGKDIALARRGSGGITATPQQFLMVFFYPNTASALAMVRDGRSEVALYRADAEAAMSGEAAWTQVADFDDVVVDGALDGDRLVLLSKKQASGGQLLQTSASTPDLAAARPIALPGRPVIEAVLASRGGLLVRTIDGAASALWRVAEDGTAERIKLPFDGLLTSMEGDAQSPEVLVGLTGWFSPLTVFRLDLQSGHMEDLGLAPPLPFDTSGYTAERRQVAVRDGVQVPYTLLMKKGTKLDATTPVLLTAYGSYGIAMMPAFNSRGFALLDRGGVYVMANVRGGGEFGRDWHYAGKAEKKANTWRDAIDVAQQLVTDKVGSSKTITLLGTSAGGVMLGGAINERPDLFAGAIANVGFMNPIRYVSEQNYADIEEWGGPIADAKSFKTMYDLDPYQHIQPGAAYPPTLVISGLNDPRAATFHGAKYAARLAAAQDGKVPVLLRIDFDAGHGMGSSRSQMDEVFTDIAAFVLWQAGRAEFQPKR